MTPSTFPAMAGSNGSRGLFAAAGSAPADEGAGFGASAAGGVFAHVLDDAAVAGTEALEATTLVDGATPGPTVPVVLAGPLPIAVPTPWPALMPMPAGPQPALAGASASATGAGLGAGPTNTRPAGVGWPPPGLSSLFPEGPVVAAPADMPTPVEPRPGASLLASTQILRASETAQALPMAGTAPAALLGEGAGLRVALPQATAMAAALPEAMPPAEPRPVAVASTGALPGAAAVNPSVVLPAATLGAEAIAAAAARGPAPLRLPADEADATGHSSLSDRLAIDRAGDTASPVATTPQVLPKLELSSAFPSPVPLPSPRFAEELGARMQWMAEQQGGEATLRISPDGLGPVEIRMKLDGERVDLGFQASQADTRQALQDALPKLREMLAQQGLQLGHADVGQRQASQQRYDEAKPSAGGAPDEDSITTASAPRAPVATSALIIGAAGRGMLDLYA